MNLTIRQIRKSYEDRPVLKDCSFSFDRHGTYVLMGRNGSGKSTLLRICALLEEPDGGAVEFSDNGSALPRDLGLRRRITLVLPGIGVFNSPVFSNVAYGLRIRGVDRLTVQARVSAALSFVGLEGKARQHARTLSSGETQRLGIARALVLDPDILFLDEPTASIDQENMEIVEHIIMTMRRQGRTTVIMTTHDRDQAELLADRLLVLKEGKLTETGV